MQRKLFSLATAAAVAGAAFAGHVSEARADGDVSSTGKGVVGGALLGGEVVTITMGIIGVDRGWPYFVFGGLGAVGGGIGGHFVDNASTTAEPSMFMLAGGMALIIPALVVSLNATAYKPPESDQTEPSTNQPAPQPPNPGGTVTSQNASHRHQAPRAFAPHVPVALLDMHEGRIALGLPAFSLRPTYTTTEIAMFGVEQKTEVHVPLFQASF